MQTLTQAVKKVEHLLSHRPVVAMPMRIMAMGIMVVTAFFVMAIRLCARFPL
eukprot:SAG22_NODE_18105_length_293_cov_0.804124_1_plen_51_part_10